MRRAAVESYSLALRTVFWAQAGVAVVTFLLCLSIEENPLPSTMAEQAKQEEEHRRGQNAPTAVAGDQ